MRAIPPAGLSWDEIGTRLGISGQYARMIARRALEKLRRSGKAAEFARAVEALTR